MKIFLLTEEMFFSILGWLFIFLCAIGVVGLSVEIYLKILEATSGAS